MHINAYLDSQMMTEQEEQAIELAIGEKSQDLADDDLLDFGDETVNAFVDLKDEWSKLVAMTPKGAFDDWSAEKAFNITKAYSAFFSKLEDRVKTSYREIAEQEVLNG